MTSKYKVKKTDLKAFFATAEIEMHNKYHSLYQELGLRKGSNGNFYCVNEDAHGGGRDANPSMSIDNATGKYICFTCQIKGNFQSYWKEYIKGGPTGDSYTDFIIDLVGLQEYIKFSGSKKDPNYERNSAQLRKLSEALVAAKAKETGKPWIMSGTLTEMIKSMTVIPKENLDKWVDNLLANKEAMDYLYQTRRIDEKVIRKYRLGWFYHEMTVKATGKKFGKWKYLFPMLNAEGDLINVKAYDPTAKASRYKWMYPFAGHETCPTPINNFTHQKLYFFEGEPDLYCAIAFGFEGAVTLGSKSINDVVDAFGKEHAKQLFTGKEVVICLDAEPDAIESANKLAVSLYPFVKQIKIIDLNKSEINPNGLDPTVMKMVGDKEKRAEKDFTDFMSKNGFDEAAVRAFKGVEEKTTYFSLNIVDDECSIEGVENSLSLFNWEATKSTRFRGTPPKQIFFIDGFLPKVRLGLIAGHGGSKKGFIILELCICISSYGKIPLKFLGEMPIASGGTVLYISTEDPEDELHRRTHSLVKGVSKKANISEDAIWNGIEHSFHIASLSGNTGSIVDKNLDETEYFKLLCSSIELYPDVTLIVIDTRIRLSIVNEIDTAAVGQELSKYEKIAKKTGAMILLVHHVSKGAQQAKRGKKPEIDQTGARGATTFVDNSRWVAEVYVPTEDMAKAVDINLDERTDYSFFHVVKSNNSKLPPKPLLIHKKEYGLLKLVDYQKEAEVVFIEMANIFLDRIKENPGNTANWYCINQAEMAENVQFKRRKINKIIEHLLSNRLIRSEGEGNAGIKLFPVEN